MSQQRSPPPCRFFATPGGCRRGTSCHFAHSTSTSSANNAQQQSHRSPSDRRSSTSSQNPNGTCRSFWQTGACRFAFDCKYKHVASDSQSQATTRDVVAAGSSSMPFLNQGGFSRLGSSGSDVFSSTPSRVMDPNEAHNTLKRFLFDDYRFRKSFDVYAFLVPVLSANTNSNLWTGEDGQLFLKTLASGNGILRINDIVLWPEVRVNAGSSTTVLSFQKGYFPIIRLLASDFVVKSTLSHLVNALYLRILENFECFSAHLENCLDAILASGTFKEARTGQSAELSGGEVFHALSVTLFECLSRFKNATAAYPRLPEIVRKLEQWTNDWASKIDKTPPEFEDVLSGEDKVEARRVLVSHLQNKVERLIAIIDREQAKVERMKAKPNPLLSMASSNEGVIAALHTLYEGPGELRKEGRRHDNDFVDINEIRVAPTQDELICRFQPFLPANLHNAPHHLPQESMERIQDIQYRLLREELTAPLRISIQHVRNDLLSKKPKTALTDILTRKGGKYKGFSGEGQDSVLFNIYTNVEFLALVPDRRGLSAKIRLDAPPGKARSPRSAERLRFWEGVGGKRFMQGGLVGLVWHQRGEVNIHLGVIASPTKEITDSARSSQHHLEARVVFFDSSIELRILNILKHGSAPNDGQKLLVESPVMFEAIRPFLEAIRAEPEAIPFKDYLVHRPSSFFSTCQVPPPKYACMPGFSYQLAPLFPPSAGITDLRLVATDPSSIENARAALAHSRLDPSQATAVVDSLIREVSLIQGPPGTGKSFVGIELLRVLVKSATPILMIAFTNHALDHLLTGVLDANITKKVVRLGSRSADERISQYSIETLETVAGRNSSRLSPMNRQTYHDLKNTEKEIDELLRQISRNVVTSTDLLNYLEVEYPEHYHNFVYPPEWIDSVRQQGLILRDEGWQKVARGRKGDEDDMDDSSPYGFWAGLQDIEFLTSIPSTPPPIAPVELVEAPIGTTGPSLANRFEALQIDSSPDEEDVDISNLDLEDWQTSGFSGILAPVAIVQPEPEPEPETRPPVPTLPTPVAEVDPRSYIEHFFEQLGYKAIPSIPQSHRPLEDCLNVGNVWDLSPSERVSLDKYWRTQVGERKAASQENKFALLRERHREVLDKHTQGQQEVRRQLLKDVDIVGCTTTGAAKLGNLLKGLGPRIMLVEEAGQVLEAHILGSLVPSVEHMILIGDPLQLRPTLNNYGLSMDSKQGSQLFRFDMSLMERLSSSGFPMSQIDVQRRMRPSISSLIRNTLYPKLVDNDLVKAYPDVRGLSKNVFFLDHQHPENGGVEEGGSRYNTYEVEMIRDLVLYLLRQGSYSQEGDIVVLCAYLGQLAKVRDALRDKVAIVIDERDQADLAMREDDAEDGSEGPEGPQIEHVKVSQRVRLRTVDNYQGEESKIVILSLVRNVGSPETQIAGGHRPTIGFLKSENRTNVALSRAKEGLFILGNRNLLASKSRMWRTVLEELEQNDSIAHGFPVACFRHPHFEQLISKPGELPSVAPDGGCLQPCDARLECGHVCPYKCHPDDQNHLSVHCMQPCTKLCNRGHPCSKVCSQSCGLCTFKIRDVELPCGHSAPFVFCYQMDALEEVKCNVAVQKSLPSCEHNAVIACGADSSIVVCDKPCSGIMTCCGRTCNSRCSECQALNRLPNDEAPTQPIERKTHISHPCERQLYCAHRCGGTCSIDHECTRFCKKECRQQCAHSTCKQNCSSLCSPCQKPCEWKCSHHQCPVPCGSVCVRVPCDKRCETTLDCGHQCPSICGEKCSDQVCPVCAPSPANEEVVDLFVYRTLADIPPDATSIEDLLITLPKCRHTFTVETLDGICHLKDWYLFDEKAGRWVGLRVPDESSGDTKKPPLCPTCRAAITAPRYGRPFKSADLEILEKNVISRMTLDLSAAQKAIQGLKVDGIEANIDRALGQMEKITPIITSVQHLGAYHKGRDTLLSKASQRNGPFPSRSLNPVDKSVKFNPSNEIVRIWSATVQPLTKALVQIEKIANVRSAHVHAWESAFSYVYTQELDAALSDPAKAPRRPEEYAMRMARLKVGQLQPRSDKRFLIEAIWMSIQVRFTLASLVIKLLSFMDCKPTVIPNSELRAWATYGRFVLDTCQEDAAIASAIAEGCEAHRLLTSSQLYILRGHLQRFQFKLDMTKRFGSVLASRDKLLETLGEQKTIVQDSIIETTERHLSVLSHDRDWFRDNFLSITDAISEEWESLEKSIRLDTFYQEVSLDEKMAIVKSFNFSHAGHWYNCPNGHTYVIDDCGGAMVQSRCPDCGETIGGSNHREEANNTLAADYVAIAQEQGAGRSMWHR
ncbi:hypothetical protein BKA70DRAFT_1558250 [Coprinopsis sp. MPI-PUGE-AT-0042]|nr:hypothetical protein BKA70DRAFT_1558250 [Coprinopsis sp. MPI-PUGE-AT-0042]